VRRDLATYFSSGKVVHINPFVWSVMNLFSFAKLFSPAFFSFSKLSPLGGVVMVFLGLSGLALIVGAYKASSFIEWFAVLILVMLVAVFVIYQVAKAPNK
jgi:hypothetical protein